jgi:hypothetical protein
VLELLFAPLLLLLQAEAVSVNAAAAATKLTVRILRMTGPFLTTSAELDRAK